MIVDSAERFSQHLCTFQASGMLSELGNAADVVDRIEFHTLPSFNDRQYARTTKLALWLQLLDAIDSAKDPAFDAADVPAGRVLVPAHTPIEPGFPIVSPEGIADPEDRRKYDEAVHANAEKTKRYGFQRDLQQIDEELTERAATYLANAFLKSSMSVREMNEALVEHIRDEKRAALLRSLVSPKIGE